MASEGGGNDGEGLSSPSDDSIRAHVVESTEKAMVDAAQRAYALLRVSSGTRECPSIESILDGLRVCFATAEAYPGQELFAMNGIWVRIDRNQNHWDLFEILVPATNRMILHREWYDSERNTYRGSDSAD